MEHPSDVLKGARGLSTCYLVTNLFLDFWSVKWELVTVAGFDGMRSPIPSEENGGWSMTLIPPG
jgi:hypothetical protein